MHASGLIVALVASVSMVMALPQTGHVEDVEKREFIKDVPCVDAHHCKEQSLFGGWMECPSGETCKTKCAVHASHNVFTIGVTCE